MPIECTTELGLLGMEWGHHPWPQWPHRCMPCHDAHLSGPLPLHAHCPPSPCCCAHTTLPEPATSPAMMSPHYCTMPLTPLPCWASPHWTSMPTACAPVRPWPSCAVMLMLTPSVSSAVGTV